MLHKSPGCMSHKSQSYLRNLLELYFIFIISKFSNYIIVYYDMRLYLPNSLALFNRIFREEILNEFWTIITRSKVILWITIAVLLPSELWLQIILPGRTTRTHILSWPNLHTARHSEVCAWNQCETTKMAAARFRMVSTQLDPHARILPGRTYCTRKMISISGGLFGC